MIAAALPDDEVARLGALRRYDVLDTPQEPSFDRVTRLAANVLDAPIILISLLDETRQWFKSRVGLDVEETPREMAFCAHTILQEDVMVVEDARLDPRFCANPLVTGDPGIRTYAGAPIVTPDGYRLGTLCAIYPEVTAFGEDRRQSLRALAAIVTDTLALRLHAAQAGGLTRAKDAFFLNISHEVRTPLNGLLGMLDLLRGSKLPRDEARRVEEAASAARRLLTFANDVVDLSSLEAKEIALHETAFSPVQLARDVVAATRGQLGAGAVLLNVARGMPRAVRADEQRVEQILARLMRRAIAVSGGEDVEMSLSWERNRLDVKVADRGGALSPAMIERLFDPLDTQRNGWCDKGEGGLGLALSKELAVLMGGSLCAACRPDGGMLLELSLPAPRACLAPQIAKEGQSALRVLIADDNAVNQAVLKAFVEKLGHSVHLADDGVAALELMKAGGYDLVMMDIQMPRLDGIAATKAIRALPEPLCGVPIIAVTANAVGCSEEEYLAAGMDGFLPKPVKPAALKRAISEVMAAAGQEALRRSA